MKLKLQYFGHLMRKTESLEKTLILGKIEGREKGMTEDEMVGWHHQLNEHEYVWTPRVGDGQGGLACCCTWAHKELEVHLQHQPFNEYSGLITVGLTGLISLQSKGLSRVFSNTTVQNHKFFRVQLSLWFNSHIHT